MSEEKKNKKENKDNKNKNTQAKAECPEK